MPPLDETTVVSLATVCRQKRRYPQKGICITCQVKFDRVLEALDVSIEFLARIGGQKDQNALQLIQQHLPIRRTASDFRNGQEQTMLDISNIQAHLAQASNLMKRYGHTPNDRMIFADAHRILNCIDHNASSDQDLLQIEDIWVETIATRQPSLDAPALARGLLQSFVQQGVSADQIWSWANERPDQLCHLRNLVRHFPVDLDVLLDALVKEGRWAG